MDSYRWIQSICHKRSQVCDVEGGSNETEESNGECKGPIRCSTDLGLQMCLYLLCS